MAAPGRYTVEKKLANGGMAEIYLGTQHGSAGFQRPVVIKRIRPSIGVDPSFRHMLIDEAHLAMGLNHSNVVQVLDLGEARGRSFLILELVDGWDLGAILRRCEAANRPLPTGLGVHICAEICRALAFAHTRMRDGKPLGIVHRDVNPRNILLSVEGEVKLTDFGIAIGARRLVTSEVGTIKGKLGYMSPEQAAGGKLDARSDLFSLGTTLYLLATSKKPFAAGSDFEILVRTQQARFDPPEAAKADIDPELAKIIRTAMGKLPEDRYPTADAMLADLERLLRERFPEAGTTELKRFLAELAQADGALPVSKAPPPLPSTGSDPLEGTAFVLDELPPTSQVITVPDNPFPPYEHRTGRKHRAALVLAALAGVAVALALIDALWSPPSDPAGAAGSAAAVDAGDAADAGPAQLASLAPADAGAEADLAPGEPDEGTLEPAPDAGVEEPEVDEKPPAPTETSMPVLDLSDPTGKRAASGVVVKFVSDPAGARLTIEKQRFGVTPARIRLKPGLTYDIVCTKSGYKPATRRIHVPNRQNQTFRIELDKKFSLWPF